MDGWIIQNDLKVYVTPCVYSMWNLGNYQRTWLGLGEIDINLFNITAIMI